MIWLLKPDQPRPTELAPAMDEDTGILPGLPSVAGNPVHLSFDGGVMTSRFIANASGCRCLSGEDELAGEGVA